jgi:hypothetical protein
MFFCVSQIVLDPLAFQVRRQRAASSGVAFFLVFTTARARRKIVLVLRSFCRRFGLDEFGSAEFLRE